MCPPLVLANKMASFATDGKVCIEREIEVLPLEVDDLLTRFDVVETSKWISRNNFLKVCVLLNWNVLVTN